MATYGNTTTPAGGYFYDDAAGDSQLGSKIFTSFPGGIITDIYVYFAGDGVTPAVNFCLWDANDTLVYNSDSNGTIGSGTRAIGGQAWQHFVVPNTVYIAPTSALRIGIWSSGSIVWTYESSGAVNYDRIGTTPGNFTSQGSEGSGDFGAYIIYTLGNARIWNSSSWVNGPLGACTAGTTFTNGVPYVWSGTAWVAGQ